MNGLNKTLAVAAPNCLDVCFEWPKTGKHQYCGEYNALTLLSIRCGAQLERFRYSFVLLNLVHHNYETGQTSDSG